MKKTKGVPGHGAFTAERLARALLLICAVVAIFAVCAITFYLFAKGLPALHRVGVGELLFGTIWKPTAAEPSFGIAYIILSSIVGTALSVLVGVPVGLLTAVFLTEVSSKHLSAFVQPAVELLAAIPSVIYGLLGMMLLNPVLFKLEKIIFAGSTTHQYTGGADLLAAVIVLAIMILPTVISVSASAIRAVPAQLRAASLALGASKMQTIWGVTVVRHSHRRGSGHWQSLGRGHGHQHGGGRLRQSAPAL